MVSSQNTECEHMKILYITTVGGTMRFFKNFIRELLDAGHTVDIATCENAVTQVPDYYREWGCTVYQISTSRSPFKMGNLKAIKQIRKIVSENGYEIVHCHTPIAAACTRLACRSLRKKGVKVFYTAHGFHFYKGAPKKNWLIYYPVEKLCARMTDVLITINKEDYEFAKKKLKAGRIEYVPGVGIDVAKFAETQVDVAEKRREIGVPEDAFLLLSVGELNANKNHETVIRAVASLQDPHIHYAIAGKGGLRDYLIELAASLGIGEQVHLIGYRRDVAELHRAADVFVLPSHREGLNVSTMEALASGMPVICSNIRGNVDLVDENGGALFNSHSVSECAEAIRRIQEFDCAAISKYNRNAARKYEVGAINAQIWKIYGI